MPQRRVTHMQISPQARLSLPASDRRAEMLHVIGVHQAHMLMRTCQCSTLCSCISSTRSMHMRVRLHRQDCERFIGELLPLLKLHQSPVMPRHALTSIHSGGVLLMGSGSVQCAVLTRRAEA